MTRSGDTSGADSVDFAVTSASADAADFGGALPSGTVNFAGGETTQTITIDVSGDTDFEADEDFTVTLSNASAGTEITTATADGTIQNDDAAPPATFFVIAADDAVKSEGDAGTTGFTFTVTRSGDTSGADSVDFAVTSASADATDFGGALPSGTVNFAGGETTQTITIDVSGDIDFEADEDFTVTLSNASAGTEITTATADGTIQNDDAAPPATFFVIAADDAVKAEGDAGTTSYTFTVTRSGDTSGADSVDFAVTSASADAADFGGALPSGTVNFAGGETTQTITIDVSGDTDFEADEDFTVTLSNASAGTEITTATADGTIQNDDAAPPATFFDIAADNAVKAEGDAGTTSYTFTVTRSGVLSGADSVDYAVTSASADAADFGGVLPSGTVNFAGGETTQTITIDVSGDTDFEADEDFTVTLSNASAGTEITTASDNGTIQNDDSQPSGDPVTLVDANFDGNGDTQGFTYADSVFGGPADQAYASGQWENGALSIDLGGINNTTVTDMSGAWQISFTLDVDMSVSLSFVYELIQAADYETDEFSQVLYSVTGATPVVVDQVTGDGNPGPILTTGVQTYNGDIGALAAGDYTLSIGGLNNKKTWNTESTEVVIDDVLLIGTPTAPPEPIVTFFEIAPTDANKDEGSGGATLYTFTVTRSGDLSGVDQVDYAVTGSGSDPATALDFLGGLLPDGTVSFAAGETSKVITIEVAGDGVLEPDEGFEVSLSNPSAGTSITTGTANGTILNDDDGSQGPVTILSADFDAADDTEGFAYSDGVFGGPTDQPYADGQWESGALTIDLGGVDNTTVFDMSGAWEISFTLDSEMTVSLSFLYEMSQAADYEADEFSQMLYSFAGGPSVLIDPDHRRR